MRPTILLFDVDGTLIHAGGAGRRAINRAFAAHTGREDVFRDFSFNGMTDPGIVREGLGMVGRPCEPALMAAILDTYLVALADEVPRASAYRVHPGVERVLDEVAGRDSVAVGLGTGNLREGARLKLTHAGLFRHFAFGGFGCDHEERAELLRIGAARGAERLGVPPAGCRVVVIGDTPRDVAAALALGAEPIGVGTSSFTPDALRAAGASHAFLDLAAPGVLEVLLGEHV
jgi:phosphoglycolate phosphatase-like HAD superfamily hydrolase